ncbi:general stress protein [Paenibacillus abyssi]|uniref:General stress protein 17M n=1 Tax=Paenibacillus abyssi TaxID=1340531 RepID=A0A917FWX4_9BACL|nr:general stress protein [Paenibacillus abyssi]GGG09063.1 general stress protein 17M [Paenibacillus abyssi]
MKPTVQVLDTGMAAINAVRDLNQRGYSQDDIYVLAHDDDHTDSLADATNANTIGMSEEGVFTSMANLFRSRGDELRAKLESIGLSEQEADQYEQELDKGKVLVIAKIH